MEGTINEALIKVVTGNGADRVMIIENLPKKFIYVRAPKRRPQIVNGYATEADIVVEGEFVDELLDGIEKSQTGDGAFVFNVNYNESAQRLKDLDEHVSRNTPRDQKLVQRVSYAQDKSDPRSGPISRDMIPRAVLPLLILPNAEPTPSITLRAGVAPVSPSAQAGQESAPAHTLSTQEWEDYRDMKAKREAARERMAAARGAKK